LSAAGAKTKRLFNSRLSLSVSSSSRFRAQAGRDARAPSFAILISSRKVVLEPEPDARRDL
jgi:hypothetical protein